MRVIVTEPAEADLEQIGDYIAAESPSRAESFVGELVARCLGLGEHPERFPVFAERGGREIRRCRHEAYLIFYAVVDRHVEVTRVLHGARDYDSLV